MDRSINDTKRATQWFAGQLKPNGLGLAERNLARQGISTFCPWMYEAMRRRGRTVQCRRPLFPGYIFLNIDPASGQWGTVNATRGLTRLVQTDPRAPTPLPDGLINCLMARCTEDGELNVGLQLAPGDRVRVLAGPFADLVTKIETITEDVRIRVLFDLMNRKVITELHACQVMKLP